MRNSFSRSDPSHQKIFSGWVSNSTSCTQSSTAWFVGFLSPIPFGGEMAGAMSLMSDVVDVAIQRNSNFHRPEAVLQEIFHVIPSGVEGSRDVSVKFSRRDS